MIDLLIKLSVKKALSSLLSIEIEEKDILISPTKKEFIGDFTLVVFPFVKQAKLSPEVLANKIGEFVLEDCKDENNEKVLKGFNVIKGFLNFEVSFEYWINFIDTFKNKFTYGYKSIRDEKPVVVEYSSPNTNKMPSSNALSVKSILISSSKFNFIIVDTEF